MEDLYYNKISELRSKGQPFVLATVVRCENPTSAKPGAKAVVLEDGTVIGWVGGSCAQPIVTKEAKKALRDGLPKLLKIGVAEAASFGENQGVRNFEMTCFSGGAMEIFIEPVLPKPQLVLIGSSPDLQALAKLGRIMNFQIIVIDMELDRSHFPESAKFFSAIDFSKIKPTAQASIVVATHGRYDEEALQAALLTQAGYIGLISSKKRAAAIFDFLKTKGVTPDDWQRVKSPAGLDIGARTPDEIALSIAAEIVEFRRRQPVVGVAEIEEEGKDSLEEAIDPICGMTVNVDDARYKTDLHGAHFYFCCAGCQQKFEQAPEKYIQ